MGAPTPYLLQSLSMLKVSLLWVTLGVVCGGWLARAGQSPWYHALVFATRLARRFTNMSDLPSTSTSTPRSTLSTLSSCPPHRCPCCMPAIIIGFATPPTRSNPYFCIIPYPVTTDPYLFRPKRRVHTVHLCTSHQRPLRLPSHLDSCHSCIRRHGGFVDVVLHHALRPHQHPS